MEPMEGAGGHEGSPEAKEVTQFPIFVYVSWEVWGSAAERLNGTRDKGSIIATYFEEGEGDKDSCWAWGMEPKEKNSNNNSVTKQI